MEVVDFVPFLAVVPLSLLLTYFTRRDLFSISAAVLAAYYASISIADWAVVSALTIVLYSLVKIAVARPSRGKRVILMKLRYICSSLILLASSILVAYIALGAAFSLILYESQPLAIIITVSIYTLMSTAAIPRLDSLSNPRLWQLLRTESVGGLLWRAGIMLGGVTMFANVITHGILGFLLMLVYLATLVASRKFKPPICGISMSLVAGLSAVLTYLVGYA